MAQTIRAHRLRVYAQPSDGTVIDYAWIGSLLDAVSRIHKYARPAPLSSAGGNYITAPEWPGLELVAASLS